MCNDLRKWHNLNSEDNLSERAITIIIFRELCAALQYYLAIEETVKGRYEEALEGGQKVRRIGP